MELQTALHDVIVIEANYKNVDRTKMRAWLLKKGLPIEIVTRLDDLWDNTAAVSDKIIEIGKIIFCKIIEFIKKYPHAAIGSLVGAAVGALINGIPLLGSLLAPLASSIGVIIGVAGGAQLDTGKGDIQSLIIVAKDFFKMIIDIFNVILKKDK